MNMCVVLCVIFCAISRFFGDGHTKMGFFFKKSCDLFNFGFLCVLFFAILAFLAVLQIVLCVTPPVELCVLEWPLSHDMPSLYY